MKGKIPGGVRWRRRLLPGLWICALLSCLSTNVSAQDVDKEILDRITKTNQSLRDIETSIGRASSRLQSELSKKENEVKSLRKQAAVVQRTADEQLLGLEQLEKRVAQWSVQSKYQRHLLASFVNNVNLSGVAVSDDGAKLLEADLLKLAHDRIQQAMAPGWTDKPVVLSSGQIRVLQVLAVGPVEVALDPGASLGGLVDRFGSETPQLLQEFGKADLQQLQSLFETGRGDLTFDPTLGNAAKLQNNAGDVWSHLEAGGVWAIPIIFFGLLALVIALIKAAQLARLPKVQVHPWTGETGELPANVAIGKFQKKLVEIARKVPVSAERDDLLVASLMEHRHRLERFMGVIATTAAVAPLLGLLGTVSGMITTFKMMTIFGSGDASTVSGGISEALVTTELGLIVAIPSLVVSALLNRYIKNYHHKLETFAVRLSKVQAKN